MSGGDFRKSFGKCVDKILGIRDQIGVQLADVSIITRTWSGDRQGDGTFADVELKILPSPQIVDFSHDLRVMEGGAVKAGDLILKSISRNKFPDEEVLRTDTNARNIAKYYKVGNHFYHLVNIRERLVTWDVHIRKTRQDLTERS